MADYDYIFTTSYTRAISKADQTAFSHRFYEEFIESSPVIAAKFEGTDMEHQARMLMLSLRHLSTFHLGGPDSDIMNEIGKQHSKRDLNIEPQMYDDWLDSLVETVRAFDPKFDDEVELAWRMSMAAGIAFMRFHYGR
jgi:truncated hemoglobin YjbI